MAPSPTDECKASHIVEFGRGQARGVGPSGRPSGINREYIKHHKPLGAPTLRRDLSAHEKLNIVARWRGACEENGVTDIAQLEVRVKRLLEKAWGFQIQIVQGWIKKEDELRGLIAKHRLGIRGVRAFGSWAPTSHKRVGSGKRIQKPLAENETAPNKPLERVYQRLGKWFREEREYGHEVRSSAIRTRLMYELEYERDKELVLQQHGSTEFRAYVLEAAKNKLAFFEIFSNSKRQQCWMAQNVLPRIGATARTAQRLSTSGTDELVDFEKAKLTWATADRFVHLVARGSNAQLEQFVCDSEKWAATRQDTQVFQ